jgi:predicted RND superfamily exporter protein
MTFNARTYTRITRTGSLLICILLVAALAPGLTKLRLDNSFEIWFPETDPALITYQHYMEEYGSDEVVVLAIALGPGVGPGEVLASSAHADLEVLHKSLTTIDGVATVSSMASIPRFDDSDEFLDAESERFTDLFVDRENSVFKLLITMQQRSDLEQIRSSVLEEIDVMSRRTFPDNDGIWMAGTGVILNALNTETISQSALFLPLSYGLILIGLAAITRSARWTGLAMGVLAGANVGMFGLMGWLGAPVTMITMALPPIALVVTVCSVLHLQRRTTALAVAMKPVVLSGLTTAGGFFSLAMADMAITRDYGLFAGWVVLLSLLFTLTGAGFIKETGFIKRTGTSLRPSLLARIVNRATRYRQGVLIGYLGLIGVALMLSSQLTVDTYSLGFLPDDHRVQADNRHIETKLGPYMPLEFILNLSEPPTRSDLLELHQLQTSVQQQIASSGASFSYADVLYADDLVQQYAPDQEVAPIEPGAWIDAAGTGLRVTWSVPMSTARELKDLRDRILNVAEPLLPAGASLSSTGYLPLYSRLIDQVVSDQLQSLGLAVLVVFALLACWLRNLRLLVVALVINVGPIVLLLGTMSALNISLDIATITVAPAMLGLIVDDSMHLLYHYQRSRKQGSDVMVALTGNAAGVGVTLVLTSTVLVLGFGILGLSTVSSIAINGLLMAWTVVLALLADLLVLPGVTLMIEQGKRTGAPVELLAAADAR